MAASRKVPRPQLHLETSDSHDTTRRQPSYTSSSHALSPAASSLGNGRSSPAGPVLTTAASTSDHSDRRRGAAMDTFGGSSSGDEEDKEYHSSHTRSRSAGRGAQWRRNSSAGGGQPQQHHQRSYSTSSNPRSAVEAQQLLHHSNDVYDTKASGYGSQPLSRVASNSRRSSTQLSRPNSRAATTTAAGVGSRSHTSTPLLYNASSTLSTHQAGGSLSNTSFATNSSSTSGNGDPHARRYSEHDQSNSHARFVNNAEGAASKYFQHPTLLSRLSPGYVTHTATQQVRNIKAALAIGVPGEWKDLNTGKWKIPSHLKAYVPLLIWVLVSLGFAVVVGVWHDQVFAGLDALSTYLKSQGLLGDFILYLCIFITTFPPLPLYSTLIILSGYSFGLFEGFAISYAAALSGAVVVFLLSKTFLKSKMDRLLEKSQGFKKVIRAVEKRPKLLFLIRVSPYPYNVMNVLLASSPTLSFSCYFWCTALALPKLLIHCAVGTTIRNFAEINKARSDSDLADSPMTDEELAREASGQRMKAIAGLVGAVLCLGVFVYLLIVARRAVDDLDDSDRLPSVDSGRSRSSTQGSSSLMTSITTIPQGRTSMAEYRPVALNPYLSASGGRDSTSYNRPASNRPRALTDDFVLGELDSDSSLPPSAVRKSFASDGFALGSRISMSTLREGDRLPTYAVLDSKYELGDSKSGPKKGNDERHLEYATAGPQEDGHGELFGDAVIDRLEEVARDRSKSSRK